MNPESMLKGRMAETLVEEMLQQAGNVVYRFGYEAIVQNLAQLEEKFDRRSKVGKRIRAIPDFIVVDKKGNPEFVEVKFRWKPRLHRNDAQKLKVVHQFWDAKLILVNCWEQPYFRVSDPPYTDKKGELTSQSILDKKSWNIGKKHIQEYEALVHKYLSPTLIPNKK